MATQDYLNFELEIEALDGNRLRVTLTDSPIGSASVDVPNPFTADEVARMIGVLEGSIQVKRQEVAQTARAFGEKLFNTIFSSQVYAAYLASQERAGKLGLRIKLSLENAGFLEDAPWELLRDPHTDYLALSPKTPIIRYPRLLTLRPLVEVSLPLRVLVVISSPSDQAALDVEGEWRVLDELRREPHSQGLLEIERLDDAQLITLQRKLSEGTDYQVFHYIGHAAFDEGSQTGMLAFEEPGTNATVPVSGESLARELSEENSIRLIVLNACQGARQNIKDPFSGIASSFVARGMPAVVAMQFVISDEASKIFSQQFYRALSEGYPIEAAIADSRRAISSTLNNLEWATPVLYLRAPTGVLFPRHTTGSALASAGGLRELLRSRLALIAGLVVLLLIIGLVVLIRGVSPAPQEIDLAVSSLTFSPRNPAPGERVSVAMVLRNNGPNDSGKFKWQWFASNPENSAPTIEGTVTNLSPGKPLTVKGDYTFDWWNTRYTTTAWVNAESDTNPFNDFVQRSVNTTNSPLTVDFTLLPDATPLLESRDLKGDEFSAWHFHIKADPGENADCKDAIVRLDVRGDANLLITGKAGQDDTCTSLPVEFTFDPDHPIGGASLGFVANDPGEYRLELFDANGEALQNQTANVEQSQTSQTLTLQVPLSGNGLNNAHKVRFSGPDGAPILIKSIRFYLVDEPLPTPTP